MDAREAIANSLDGRPAPIQEVLIVRLHACKDQLHVRVCPEQTWERFQDHVEPLLPNPSASETDDPTPAERQLCAHRVFRGRDAGKFGYRGQNANQFGPSAGAGPEDTGVALRALSKQSPSGPTKV